MSGFFASLRQFFAQVAILIMVAPWEQAIRVRAGRHVRRLNPGLHLRIPLLDAVFKQTVRRRNTLLATQTLSTADGATIVIGASMGYAITDIEALYKTLHDAEDTLRQIAATALAASVLRNVKASLKPDIVGEQVTAEMAAALAAYGIGEVDIRVTDFAYIRAFRLVMDQRWGAAEALNMNPAA